ncbi:uncharacterized protein TNCV_3130651 [Trichonephila clavipes]|nr:uncharacterized protein TNCV_3130651 [Trichonephila clavipes]
MTPWTGHPFMHLSVEWSRMLGWPQHPQTTSNLLQIIDKYEEKFLNRKIRGSSWEFRYTNPSENNRFPNRNRQENWRETRDNNMYSDNIRPRREFNRLVGQGVADNRRFDG